MEGNGFKLFLAVLVFQLLGGIVALIISVINGEFKRSVTYVGRDSTTPSEFIVDTLTLWEVELVIWILCSFSSLIDSVIYKIINKEKKRKRKKTESKNEVLNPDIELIGQAIESAECRIYRLMKNKGESMAHQVKAENQRELMEITIRALEYYKIDLINNKNHKY